MRYYSYLSKHIVTECEAHIELFHYLARWFYWAHPNGNFDHYILNHPSELTVEDNAKYYVVVDEQLSQSLSQ